MLAKFEIISEKTEEQDLSSDVVCEILYLSRDDDVRCIEWSDSGAPAERQRSASGAPAKRQRSASVAPAERQRSASGAPVKRQSVQTVQRFAWMTKGCDFMMDCVFEGVKFDCRFKINKTELFSFIYTYLPSHAREDHYNT